MNHCDYNFIITRLNKNIFYKCNKLLNIDNLIILYKYKYKHCNLNNYIYSKNKATQVSFSNINIIYHHLLFYFFPLKFYMKNRICFINDYYNNIDKVNNYYFYYTFLKKETLNENIQEFDVIYINNIKITKDNINSLIYYIVNNLVEGGDFYFIINNNNIFYKKLIYLLANLFDEVILFHHEMIDNIFIMFNNKIKIDKIKNSYISPEFNQTINDYFYKVEQGLINKYKRNNDKNNYIIYYKFLYDFSLMMSKKNNMLTNEIINKVKKERNLLPFFFNGLNMNQGIKYTPISTYSVTLPVNAHIISNIIKKDFPDARSITDSTANIGGNTLSFSLFFEKVNAVEYDKETCDYLEHNMNIYRQNNINFYCADYTKIFQKLKEDIIYIDPPWSGIDYKKKKKLKIELGDYEISEFIQVLLKKDIMGIYVKLPSNSMIKLNCDYKIIKIANFILVCIISHKNNKHK